MTAEIAILNRNAVALAADSAVTLNLPEGPKIYLSNKLFTLSKYEPVGVMVFGNADFMDVPWETIVKDYRAQLGKRSFAHIDDYTSDFLTFLEIKTSFFPSERQEAYCYQSACAWLRKLTQRLRRAVDHELQRHSGISSKTVNSMFREIVRLDLEHLRRHKNVPRLAKLRPSALLKQYRGSIQRAIADEVQQRREKRRFRTECLGL